MGEWARIVEIAFIARHRELNRQTETGQAAGLCKQKGHPPTDLLTLPFWVSSDLGGKKILI